MATADAGQERPLGLKLALISAGAALAGALIGGAGSFGGVVYTGNNAADRSQTEFLRQQRIAVYSKFLLDVNAFDNALTQCAKLTPLDVPVPPEDAAKQLDAALRDLRNDLATVMAVGSTSAVSSARSIRENLGQMDKGDECSVLGQPDQTVPDPAPDPYTGLKNILTRRGYLFNQWQSVNGHTEELTLQIRRDVGAEGL